jgi:hypothetical protein
MIFRLYSSLQDPRVRLTRLPPRCQDDDSALKANIVLQSGWETAIITKSGRGQRLQRDLEVRSYSRDEVVTRSNQIFSPTRLLPLGKPTPQNPNPHDKPRMPAHNNNGNSAQHVVSLQLQSTGQISTCVDNDHGFIRATAPQWRRRFHHWRSIR